MDEVDQRIIEILEEDARASFTDIAEEVGVSEGTVRNRVESMEENDVIDKYTVELGAGSSISAFISVKVSADRSFDQITSNFPQELEVYELAGDIDILIKVRRDSAEQVNELVDEIRAIEGVNSTQTYMVLAEK